MVMMVMICDGNDGGDGDDIGVGYTYDPNTSQNVVIYFIRVCNGSSTIDNGSSNGDDDGDGSQGVTDSHERNCKLNKIIMFSHSWHPKCHDITAWRKLA